LCEIKHTLKEFVITKKYFEEIKCKQEIYKLQTRTKKQIQWCLITNNGVLKNQYYKKLIGHVVKLDDLFKDTN